jgi:FkbM family methyltransferase
MTEGIKESVRSAFASLGIFVARQFPNRVTGHELRRDLQEMIQQPDPVCFDVGANQGQTIQLFQRCFKRPTIHAFEPASTTYAELAKRSFGPQVHLYPIAFGERYETAQFRNYKHSDLNSFLTTNPTNLFGEEELLLVESVQVDTLDRFCSTQEIGHIDLLKIDTQGFEMPVLRGGERLLREQRVGAVLLELNFSALYEGQSDYMHILELLRRYDMRLIDFYEKERITGRELSWTTAFFARC